MYPTSSALSSDRLPVFIDTTCRSSFQDPPDRPDFKRTNWTNFQTHLEDHIPFDPKLHDGMAINTYVENFSVAGLRALAASTPKRRPRADPRPPIQAGIQVEICLKNRLWRHCHVTTDPTLRAEVNRLQMSVTRRFNEWINPQWSATLLTLGSEDQSPWRMTKRVMRVSTPSSSGQPGEIALSDSEKVDFPC